MPGSDQKEPNRRPPGWSYWFCHGCLNGGMVVSAPMSRPRRAT